MESSYITSAQQAEQLPHLGGLPEVAFIGRSNCGKSSLLNALLGRVGLARESKTPGRTQMVNFFKVSKGDQALILADLPGYGYAAAGREIRQHWDGLVKGYMERPTVKEFIFLVDVRRASDLDDEDLKLLSYLAAIQSVTVVLTKIDKANQRDISAAQAAVTKALARLKVKALAVVPVSSLKKKGIEPLRERLLGYMQTITQ